MEKAPALVTKPMSLTKLERATVLEALTAPLPLVRRKPAPVPRVRAVVEAEEAKKLAAVKAVEDAVVKVACAVWTVTPLNQAAPETESKEVEALAKELRPVQVLELASKVVEAEPIVALPPRPRVMPLMVKAEEVAMIFPAASVARTEP